MEDDCFLCVNVILTFYCTLRSPLFCRHALDTVEEAAKLSIPISQEETLFSTPADTQALQELFKLHPYPSTKSYIRKNHG